MRIFIVSRGYPTSKYVGNGIFEFDQAKALRSIGYEVIFLSLDLRSFRHWRKWGFVSLIKEGIRIEGINLPVGRVPQGIFNFIGRISLLILFQRCQKKYGKPTLIHAHFTRFAYITLVALRASKIPILMTEHSSRINRDSLPKRERRIAKFVYTNSSKVFVVSKSLQNRVKEIANIKTIVVPNIVDLSLFNTSSEKFKSDKFKIVSVGNLIPLKKMDLLINAFNKYCLDNSDSTLMIFGDGPERPKLDKQIINLGLESNVILRGSCERKVIAEELRSASCFVLVSQSETFGLAYVEALASGIPVIATKCGGPEDFVNESNGILIPL